jgi:hypothetical protein
LSAIDNGEKVMHGSNHQFDLLGISVLIFTIIFTSVSFYYKRDEIKSSYKGSLMLIGIGGILLSLEFIHVVDKIPDWDINLIFDYLLFVNLNIFSRSFYLRAIGYLFVIIGIELLFMSLAMRRKHSSN